jgi:hypothetical protein
MQKAYDEVIEFIAVNNPGWVMAFRSSAEAKDRVADLISREKTDDRQPRRSQNWIIVFLVEELMRLAKARAHRHLSMT